MTLSLMDPTGERETGERARLARQQSLDGLTVGVLDISKIRGDVFVEEVAKLLEGRGKIRKELGVVLGVLLRVFQELLVR